MFFTNKKFSVLFLSLILLICSNSTECKPKQFIRKPPSKFSLFIDIQLAAITALLTSMSIQATYKGMCTYIRNTTTSALNSKQYVSKEDEFCRVEGLYYLTLASATAITLYFKHQLRSEVYEEIA